MTAERFLDTNVIVYAFAGEGHKADRAETLLADGGVVSVQVLNELANVALRKLALTHAELDEVLAIVRALCKVVPVTVDTHVRAVALAKRHRLGIFDACIVAAAEGSGCSTLWSEDLQHGARIGSVTIRNPFAALR